MFIQRKKGLFEILTRKRGGSKNIVKYCVSMWFFTQDMHNIMRFQPPQHDGGCRNCTPTFYARSWLYNTNRKGWLVVVELKKIIIFVLIDQMFYLVVITIITFQINEPILLYFDRNNAHCHVSLHDNTSHESYWKLIVYVWIEFPCHIPNKLTLIQPPSGIQFYFIII